MGIACGRRAPLGVSAPMGHATARTSCGAKTADLRREASTKKTAKSETGSATEGSRCLLALIGRAEVRSSPGKARFGFHLTFHFRRDFG
jgi:hypothetical protein